MDKLVVRGALFAVVAAGFAPSPAYAQRMHRQDFEGGATRLQLLLAEQDAQAKLEAHALSPDDPHGGKQCERIVVNLTGGKTCLVAYPFGKTPVIDELSLTAWVKANRPGVQIRLRVILPRDIDPQTNNPTWMWIEGESSSVVGRWDPIKVSRPREALMKQRGLLQARRGKAVDVREAYADMLLLNIHTGVGVSDVSVDDIEVGPIVTPSAAARMDASPNLAPLNMADEPVETPAVKDAVDKRRSHTDKGRLLLGDRGFFIRGVRRSSAAVGAELIRLREAQFNTVFMPWPIEPDDAAEAQRLDLHLVPMLDLVQGGADGKAPRPGLDLDVRERERWLAWHLGGNLDAASAPAVHRVAAEIRSRDVERGRPIMGHVVEGLSPLTRDLNIGVVQRYPLGTSLSLTDFGRWMAERRRLASGLPVMIGGIQTHPQLDAAKLAFGHGPEEAYSAPVGPQPAQLELLVCHSLAAGCRGIIMSADWALSEHAQGFDRMLECALINEKLRLVETFLAEGQSPEICRTDHKNFKAVAFPHPRGLLVLAYWCGENGQYVVGQATETNVNVVVDGAPDGAQVHLIDLAGAKALTRQNGVGGTRVTLPEIDVCAWILITTEANILAKFQEKIADRQRVVGPLQQQLAEADFAKVEELVARLQGEGLKEHALNNSRRHLDRAREHLERGREARKNGDFIVSLKESRVVLRTVRAVEDELWKSTAGAMKEGGATAPPPVVAKGKDGPLKPAPEPTLAPVSDPFATSVYTLPEHMRFQASLKKANFGEDLLGTGDFERDGNLDAVGWQYVPFTTNGLEPTAMLVADARKGKRSLELSATPTKQGDEEKAETPPVVEHTRVAMVSPPVPVKEGQIVKISGYVKIPKGMTGSVDGAMVWDSLGGEALALRFVKTTGWTPFVLYRPVRANGKIRVHLVATGAGAVQFDDLQIQTTDVPAPLAGRALGDPTRLR